MQSVNSLLMNWSECQISSGSMMSHLQRFLSMNLINHIGTESGRQVDQGAVGNLVFYILHNVNLISVQYEQEQNIHSVNISKC